MIVYAVVEGEEHHGYSIRQVCATEDTARAVIQEILQEGSWSTEPWRMVSKDQWAQGVDFLSVIPCEVAK